MRKFWIGYLFKNWYLPYKLGYAIVITGARTYFKKLKYQGKEKIPKNAGIIYAVNHQNAFLDPIIIAGQTNSPINFLARADIFKNKIANKILRRCYMLPIFRQRDGVNTIEKNEESFIACYEMLSKRENLMIFPEGNHNYKKMLRPLKKGLARVAFGTLSKFGKEAPLYIVPVGIDYENHFNMNSEVLLNVGDPIKVSDYYSSYQENSAETINRLSLKIGEDLGSLIINIEDLENYDELYYLLHRFPLKEEHVALKRKFDLRKEKLNITQYLKADNPKEYNKLIDDIKSIKAFMVRNKIRPYILNKNPYSYMKLIIFSSIMFLVLPFHLIGLTTNYIPYKIPVWFVEKKIRDKHFHSSLKLAIGVILFALYWLLIALSLTIFKGWLYGLIFILSAPIIAMLNFRYWILIVKLNARWNYKRATKKEAFNSIKEMFDKVQEKFN
jgi:1-acyl-sn-glycerol-3-phosphate acyltransferase